MMFVWPLELGNRYKLNELEIGCAATSSSSCITHLTSGHITSTRLAFLAFGCGASLGTVTGFSCAFFRALCSPMCVCRWTSCRRWPAILWKRRSPDSHCDWQCYNGGKLSRVCLDTYTNTNMHHSPFSFSSVHVQSSGTCGPLWGPHFLWASLSLSAGTYFSLCPLLSLSLRSHYERVASFLTSLGSLFTLISTTADLGWFHL